jgi:hypothetical protein
MRIEFDTRVRWIPLAIAGERRMKPGEWLPGHPAPCEGLPGGYAESEVQRWSLETFVPFYIESNSLDWATIVGERQGNKSWGIEDFMKNGIVALSVQGGGSRLGRELRLKK